ncbi:MAG: CRISPR-associated endonuclease Cas2 [Theionarchaea archaeon]|nr:CRISPR-associated endonuclease Cas2 [Theionarchaea archaeon]
MYVIVVYDVSVERVDKVRIFLKQYLNWMQNSVLEGEVTKARLKEIELGVEEIIEKKEDSVIIYTVRDEALVNRRFIGEPKVEPTNIL